MAKKEALDNNNSLLIQNIQSYNVRPKRRRQRRRTVNKKTIGLISKKASLHVQHIFCTVLCRSFARLRDETSRNTSVARLHVLCWKCRTCSCSFFFSLPLIFTLVTASISHFLTTKFSCCSSNKKCLLFYLLLVPFAIYTGKSNKEIEEELLQAREQAAQGQSKSEKLLMDLERRYQQDKEKVIARLKGADTNTMTTEEKLTEYGLIIREQLRALEEAKFESAALSVGIAERLKTHLQRYSVKTKI